MVRHDSSAGGEKIPAPGLLILTGASHTGKTTVAEAILRALPRPAAFLSVDEILHRALRRAPGDLWSNIPLAYEILRADLGVLLDHDWLVIVESTFTYVPPEGAAEFHADALARLIAEAESRRAATIIAQLSAPRQVILARAEGTDRLDLSIVAATIDAHAAATFPLTPVVVDTDALETSEAATAIVAHLDDRISSPGS